MAKKVSATMSIEDIQAIMNATGEASPNIPLTDEVCKKMRDFDHTHDTVTDNDCFLAIFNVRIGKPKDNPESEDEAVMAVRESFSGCPEDLDKMLTRFLYEHPEFVPVFAHAIGNAVSEMGNSLPSFGDILSAINR